MPRAPLPVCDGDPLFSILPERGRTVTDPRLHALVVATPGDGPAVVARAPARVNLIGDYGVDKPKALRHRMTGEAGV